MAELKWSASASDKRCRKLIDDPELNSNFWQFNSIISAMKQKRFHVAEGVWLVVCTH